MPGWEWGRVAKPGLWEKMALEQVLEREEGIGCRCLGRRNNQVQRTAGATDPGGRQSAVFRGQKEGDGVGAGGWQAEHVGWWGRWGCSLYCGATGRCKTSCWRMSEGVTAGGQG